MNVVYSSRSVRMSENEKERWRVTEKKNYLIQIRIGREIWVTHTQTHVGLFNERRTNNETFTVTTTKVCNHWLLYEYLMFPYCKQHDALLSITFWMRWMSADILTRQQYTRIDECVSFTDPSIRYLFHSVNATRLYRRSSTADQPKTFDIHLHLIGV